MSSMSHSIRKIEAVDFLQLFILEATLLTNLSVAAGFHPSFQEH
jgi:hypothetical protein